MANATTLAVVLFACLGSWTWGYVAGIIASTLAQTSFNTYMAFTESNLSPLQGTINSLFSVGGFIGCFASVWLNEQKGRRWGIFVGCILSALGSGISAGAVNIPMFIVGRFVVGLGVGHLLVLIPIYQSEIVPHTHRGLFVGLHGVMLCVGYASSNWIGYAFFFVRDSAINWRIPLAIGGIPALILAACVFLLPESPRFLVQNGRNEEALAICCKLQYDKANPDSELYLREHAQTVEQYELDKEAPSTWMSLVTVPHYRRRCIIGHLTMFFVQCSGNLVITNYAPILYGRLGYDVNKQLLLAGAWITLAPFGNLLNAYLLDKVGRRPLLSFGLMGCVVCLIAEAISVARFQATGAMSASLTAVAFLFFHMFFFCTTQDASSYVYVSEIFPTHRVAISVSGLFLSTLIFVSAAPSGFQTIGWKYYLVLIVPAFIGSIVEFLYWPETRGLTLEEIATVFGDTAAHQLAQMSSLELSGVGEGSDSGKARHQHVESV